MIDTRVTGQVPTGFAYKRLSFVSPYNFVQYSQKYVFYTGSPFKYTFL